MEISEAEYNELKRCHQMLGQIGGYVEDFCEAEDTTLQGVIRLLAGFYFMKSEELYEKLESLSLENQRYENLSQKTE